MKEQPDFLYHPFTSLLCPLECDGSKAEGETNIGSSEDARRVLPHIAAVSPAGERGHRCNEAGI